VHHFFVLTGLCARVALERAVQGNSPSAQTVAAMGNARTVAFAVMCESVVAALRIVTDICAGSRGSTRRQEAPQTPLSLWLACRDNGPRTPHTPPTPTIHNRAMDPAGPRHAARIAVHPCARTLCTPHTGQTEQTTPAPPTPACTGLFVLHTLLVRACHTCMSPNR